MLIALKSHADLVSAPPLFLKNDTPVKVIIFSDLFPMICFHRRLPGGGEGAMALPQRPDKNEKIAQSAAICIIKTKIFPGAMPPDPPNSLICSVFLALDAAGPLQCECLEPPVFAFCDFLCYLFLCVLYLFHGLFICVSIVCKISLKASVVLYFSQTDFK